MPLNKTLTLTTLASALALGACSSTMADDTAATASTSASATTPMADTSVQASTGANPTVGGAEMFPTKTIVENASASADHTTLVAAVKAAGLVETLSGVGPFTVFAPTNDAFSRLAPGTVDTLLKPENKAALVKVLTYHVVSGNVSAAQLVQQINAGGGTATLTTVQGGPLKATLENNVVVLTDVNGNKSFVTQADVRQSNGVVHVVNGVLIPAQT